MKNIPIEVSARHIHLNKKACEALFGKDFTFTVKKALSQPGEFAAKETVSIETEKARIDNVRVLGPLRDYVQVEISRSDAYRLGLNPPVRDSHELNHDGTPGIKVIGPKRSIALTKGVIIPWRHIHMNHNEALELGVEDGQIVKVDIDDNPRTVVFENVIIRVAADHKLAMHIDTDEANASGIIGKGIGRLVI